MRIVASMQKEENRVGEKQRLIICFMKKVAMPYESKEPGWILCRKVLLFFNFGALLHNFKNRSDQKQMHVVNCFVYKSHYLETE